MPIPLNHRHWKTDFVIHPPPKPTPGASSGQSSDLTGGLEKVQEAIRLLAEPLRHANEEVNTAQAAWQVLTPYHHLFTYDAEVAYLSEEWKSFRNLCQQMEDRLKRRRRRRFRRPAGDQQTLARLRAQLAAVDVRLNVLEDQRKAASVVDVMPADVTFAGNNLKAAQEWALTLRTELDELEAAAVRLRYNDAA